MASWSALSVLSCDTDLIASAAILTSRSDGLSDGYIYKCRQRDAQKRFFYVRFTVFTWRSA